MDSNEKLKISLYAVADGELISIEEVNDITFASKMMGRGYAIRPTNGSITAPVEGVISEVFPTDHVVGFKTGELDVLLHMGINTVQLGDEPFETNAILDNKVNAQTQISIVDLDMIDQPGISSDMIILFINGNKVIDKFELYDLKEVKRGQEVGYVILK